MIPIRIRICTEIWENCLSMYAPHTGDLTPKFQTTFWTRLTARLISYGKTPHHPRSEGADYQSGEERGSEYRASGRGAWHHRQRDIQMAGEEGGRYPERA